MTALGREGSSPSLRIGKELAIASSFFVGMHSSKPTGEEYLFLVVFSFNSKSYIESNYKKSFMKIIE